MTVSAQQATDAANEVFGRHPGSRALHAKGTLLTGTFTASAEAARLTRAAHMQGEPHRVTVRVSNGSGRPDDPDYAPDLRGLAVKIYLPDGSRTDILAQTSRRFPAHTPDEFIELLRAQKRPAVAWKMPLFLARHPDALAALPGFLAALKPPESYAECTYYAIHAYRFLDAEGGSRYVRYTFVPEAGDRRISPREAKGRGRDYLQQEIRRRLEQGPVRFELELQIAAPGDRVEDPAAAWPSDRRRVTAGVLELTGLDTEREQGDDVLLFDPARVTDGIELSDDPVLQFRHAVYSDSVARRMA